MRITVDKNVKTPVYWQIYENIKEKILRGELADGAVLPSEREMGRLLGVHRNTVIKAYGVLKDEQLVDSRPGVGYRVTFPDGQATKGKEPGGGSVNWSFLIKDDYLDMEKSYDNIFLRFARETGISFSSGMPPQVYSEAEIADDIASILNEENRKPFFLSPYQGDLTLRRKIAAYLRTKGIRSDTDQVQVLSETNQALDFLAAALLRPGDKVIIEEPVSPDVYRVINLAGCSAVTVPVDEDGMMTDGLENLIRLHRPRFIYVNSSFHDPTGNILSLERRKKLIEISNKYRLPIVEEDAASELAYGTEGLPTIKSMDKNNNVIYIYSFSLTFIPGMSMAFVAASKTLVNSLSYMVSIRLMTLDWLTQKLLAKYLTDGTYEKKLKEIIALNREKRDVMCSYLDRLKEQGLSYKKPEGGVYVWCRLPEGMRGRDVMTEALRHGISLIPGDVFFPERHGGKDFIRLNYSFETGERLEKGMEILTDIITDMNRQRAGK